jgi:CheY-like chemotaxis protein/HPt (histidine-containing phosphotransfer) domain-containing protein
MPGKGSRFHLSLPLAPAQPGSKYTPQPRKGKAFPGARVLVAEDNPVNQKLASYMLEGLGVDVALVENGRQAYDRLAPERVRSEPIDLVLMDFQMPEWDGLTATHAIRQREAAQGLPRLPILALTANAMAGFDRTCLEAGMDGVLTKPLTDADLNAALARWLPDRAADRPTLTDAPARDDSAPQPHSQYDAAKIRKLCHYKPERIEEMLRLFMTSTEPLLEALSAALRKDDAAQAARQAHQIKGAAAYMGAEDMTHLASDLEKRAKAGQLVDCDVLLEDLEAAFIALRLELEEEIKNTVGG